MKKLFFVLIATVFSSNIFSQQFNITTVGFEADVTVDYFSNEIYIAPWTQSLVGKYEFISNSAHSTDFEGLPVFMHNSYKSINMEITDTSNAYYIRDFESGSKRKLFEIIFGKTLLKAFNYNMPYHTISQNDKYLFNYSVFVIDDSLWLRSHFQIFGEGYPYSWSSDSSVVYLSQDNAIAEYNIFTKTIDTLVSHSEGDIILNLDYNIKEDLLAYTIENKFYVFDNKSKTSIFELETSTLGWVEIYDLKWNEDETKIAFLGYDYTNPISVIYIYETDSNKVFVAQNSGYGLKTSLQWLNNDTLLYIADNDLYGYDISGITDVDDNLSSLPNKFILEQNYPNPFNPSTKISYTLPQSGFVQLKLFDVLGKEVAILVNNEQNAGNYKVNFNAVGLSSGVYFYTLQSGNFKKSKKMILLK